MKEVKYLLNAAHWIAYTSAWWFVAVFCRVPYEDGGCAWLVPCIWTVLLGALVVAHVIAHWSDDE